MKSEYIPLHEAEKIVQRSRATLVRLCHIAEKTGHAKRIGRAWHIEKTYLMQRYDIHVSEAQKAREQTNVKGMQSIIERLLDNLGELTRLNEHLSKENRMLLEENRRLLAAPNVQGRKDYTYIIVVVVLSVVVVGLLWIVAK